MPAPPASPASGAPALKRRRKLGAPLVNGSGLPTLAWPPPGQEGPPVSPVDGGGHPDPLPKGRKLKKKKGEPSSLDLYGLATQKSAIFKKRKKGRTVVNLVEHSRVLESELKLVQALVSRLGSGVRGCGGARSALWATERSWLITHLICQQVSEQVSHVRGRGRRHHPLPLHSTRLRSLRSRRATSSWEHCPRGQGRRTALPGKQASPSDAGPVWFSSAHGQPWVQISQSCPFNMKGLPFRLDIWSQV